MLSQQDAHLAHSATMTQNNVLQLAQLKCMEIAQQEPVSIAHLPALAATIVPIALTALVWPNYLIQIQLAMLIVTIRISTELILNAMRNAQQEHISTIQMSTAKLAMQCV